MILFLLLQLAWADVRECYRPAGLLSMDFLEMPAIIFPQEMKRNLHFIHRNFRYSHASCRSDEVWVQGPVFTEDGLDSLGVESAATGVQYETLGQSFCMPRLEFEKERRLGESVFETRVASGSKNEGTSYLIGGNVVMTNYHIAGGGADPKDCRKVELALNNPGEQEWIKCKKLLFCDKQNDYCFVEMESPSPGKKIADVVSPLKLNCAPVTAGDAKLIGNSYTLGIQASDGKGSAQMANGQFKHKIPMVGGSSGSPIFNGASEVMGINFGHSGNSHFVSNDLNQTNYGTSMNSVFSRIKQEYNNAYFAVPSFLQTPAQREEILRDLNLIREQLPANSNCR
jgi:V8-like Glu-specific endopeptidase